jgi:hypothetical protein
MSVRMTAETSADVLRRLSALPEGSLRDRAAVRFLVALDPEQGADLIEHALQRLRRGQPAEVNAGSAVVQAVLPELGLPYDRRAELYVAAKAQGLVAASLFLSPPPKREAPKPLPGMESELSLGHRRTLARTAPPEKFARLGAEKDVRIARELLQNPKLTEREVVRIASGRPAQPEVLLAIGLSARFATRVTVRIALARNPYSPTRLALRFLPHLTDKLLQEISVDGTLHPEVRQFAAALLQVQKP